MKRKEGKRKERKRKERREWRNKEEIDVRRNKGRCVDRGGRKENP